MARFAVHLGLVLVALLVVSGSARFLLEEDVVDAKSLQESKFKGGKPHHDKPKLPTFPKPTLPSFTLPGCSPPPPKCSPPPASTTPTSTYTPTYSPPPPTYSSPPPPSTGY